MKASVKYKVIYRHREQYSISEMYRFFGVSRSGYYCYTKRMDIPSRNLPLAEQIRDCQKNVTVPTATEEYISGLRGTEYIAILKQY